MKNIWTDGSSARRSWDNPYTSGNKHCTSNYHPSVHDRKRDNAASVEYITPPALYDLQHPTKAAIRNATHAAVTKTTTAIHSIPTATLSICNQGLILATKWINIAIGALVALLGVFQWVAALCLPTELAEMVNAIWSCGYSTAIVCTICILIYRYHQILEHRLNRAGGLRKRSKITNSLKKTLFMFGRSLLILYGVLVPHIAEIIQIMLS